MVVIVGLFYWGSLLGPLGVYPYAVKWSATPAGLERSLTLKAPLGGAATDFFKFQHLAKVAVDYKARIEAAPGHKGPVTDFILEDLAVSTPACDDSASMKELQLRVRYQPSSLGSKDTLTIA